MDQVETLNWSKQSTIEKLRLKCEENSWQDFNFARALRIALINDTILPDLQRDEAIFTWEPLKENIHNQFRYEIDCKSAGDSQKIILTQIKETTDEDDWRGIITLNVKCTTESYGTMNFKRTFINVEQQITEVLQKLKADSSSIGNFSTSSDGRYNKPVIENPDALVRGIEDRMTNADESVVIGVRVICEIISQQSDPSWVPTVRNHYIRQMDEAITGLTNSEETFNSLKTKFKESVRFYYSFCSRFFQDGWQHYYEMACKAYDHILVWPSMNNRDSRSRNGFSYHRAGQCGYRDKIELDPKGTWPMNVKTFKDERDGRAYNLVIPPHARDQMYCEVPNIIYIRVCKSCDKRYVGKAPSLEARYGRKADRAELHKRCHPNGDVIHEFFFHILQILDEKSAFPNSTKFERFLETENNFQLDGIECLRVKKLTRDGDLNINKPIKYDQKCLERMAKLMCSLMGEP